MYVRNELRWTGGNDMFDKVKILACIRRIIPYGIMDKRRRKQVEDHLKYLPKTNGPKFYDKDGKLFKVFYLKDELLGWQYYSYTRHRFPSGILWDRNNPSLSSHFYAHENIENIVGTPVHKYAILVETEEIAGGAYKKLLENETLAVEFDLIFTHSEKLLNKYSNARFIPAGGVWYGLPAYGGKIADDLYKRKIKDISIVSSDKVMCNLHRVRLHLARKLKNNWAVDTYGTFDGGKYVKISETLESYRYSIVIENTVSAYCFTEKVLNCFASMTIPIYLGATKISNFFNVKGMIIINQEQAENGLEEVIKKCTPEYYSECLEAILDNFNRVNDYLCQEDYITSHYLNELK